MARENEGKALKTGRFFVGLSAIIGLTAIPGAVGQMFLHVISGGSFCEIVSGPTLITGTGATNSWGQGFVIDQTQTPWKFNCAGNMYFISAGATAQIAYAQPVSAGFET